MRKSMKLLLGSVAVAAGALLCLVSSGSEPTPAAEPEPAAPEAATPSSPRARAAEGAEETKAPVEPPPAPSAAAVVRVVDGATGAPIAGARVRAVASTAEWSAVTGAGGDALLPPDCAGTVTIWVTAEGWGARRLTSVRARGEPVRVELMRGTRLRILWRTERGDELAVADVRARYEHASAAPAVRVVSESAIDTGRWSDRDSPLRSRPGGWQSDATVVWSDAAAYVSDRLGPGRWRLVVQRPAAAPFLTEPFDVTGADEATVRVELAESGSFRRVRFVDALDGHALAGAAVVPWFTLVKDFAQLPGGASTTDADGVATLPLARADATGPRPTWSLDGGTHATEFDDSVLASRPTEDPLVVRVFPTATIAGEAYLRPGVPAAGAEVSWSSRGGPAVRCVCGPDGRFSLTGPRLRKAPEEVVSLCLASEAGSRFFAVQAAAGATTNVVLGPKDAASSVARVAGRVSAGGRPLAGLQVVLAPLADPRTLLFASTSDDGEFAFDSVPSGTAKLRVTCGDPRVADAFRIASATPIRVAGGETTQLAFDLPDASFAVTVVDAATGEPVEGVRVTATPLDVRDAATRFPGAVFTPGWSAFSDSAGRAVLPGVVAVAAHRIDATDGRGRSARAEDAIPGTVSVPSEVRLALSK